MKYITLIIGLLVMGCGKTDAERLEEEKWTQEYETEFQMSEDENKRLKAEIESNKLKAEKSNTSTNSPPQPTGQNSAKAKPVRKLTAEEKKVIGTYEMGGEGFTIRAVFLDNGIIESYKNGKKEEEEDKWKIVDGELHIIHEGGIAVFRINKDGNITGIADIEDGKREDFPKENQHTIQKIK